MQFFDLNIPYMESGKSIPDKSAKKQNRLKLIVKAMELGYSGIAYNHTIKGVMSESDRCSIPPFPLSSLLRVSPLLLSTVSFHRRLLGVPESSPFRQYTRLTVLVETATQASALNSGNPILKTYDLVAVRPLNQTSFDLSCQSSQVDLISIDFAEKLPFRLKLPMVKAAIARGVYFEITYSSLMEDAQVRRQMISNAKLLVDWTRGKSLIVSSASPSVLELRGPNDVANLSSLLGLSNEHAKAAISKNCRSLLANAIRKKQFYKEAIRVEVMPAGAQTDPKAPWIVDYLDWDPISSGEGDLLLDDMAKSFAKSNEVSQTAKAIDFASIVDNVPLPGLQVEVKSHPSGNSMDFASISENLEASKETENLQKVPTSQQGKLPDSSKASSILEGSKILLKNSDDFETSISPVGLHEPMLHAENLLFSSSIRETPTRDADLDVGCGANSREEVSTSGVENDSSRLDSCVLNRMEVEISTEMQLSDKSTLSLSPDVSLSQEDLMHVKNDPLLATNSTIHADKMVMDVDSFVERNNNNDGLLLLEEVGKDREEIDEDESHVKTDTKESVVVGTMMHVDSFPVRKHDDHLLVAKTMLSEDMMVEAGKRVEKFTKTDYPSLGGNKSGNHKIKHFASRQVLRFPFKKRLFEVQFKKKGRSSVYKTHKR